MNNEMWRNLIIIFLMIHGVGHLGGFWWLSYSWLLARFLGDSTMRFTILLLWLIAVIGFTGAGLGILVQEAWWRPLTIIASMVSLLVIGLVRDGGMFGAGLADIAILVALWWARWPPAAVVGA